MNRRIGFLVTSRYPTDKAYGITIGRTCEALKKIGVDVYIYAPTNQNRDDFGNIIQDIRPFLKRSFPVKENKPRLNTFITQLLDAIRISQMVRREIRANGPLFIVSRDLIFSVVLSLWLKPGYVTFEVHRSFSRFRRLYLSPILFFRRLKIVSITEQSFEEWRKCVRMESLSNIPMGVEDTFFQKQLERSYNRKIAMCFLGKAQSSGFDNGLESFIKILSQISSSKRRIELWLVGLTQEEFACLYQFEAKYFSLKYVKHINHKQVPNMLKKFSVGVVPYPDNAYHRYRFPIKILEYAAANLSILASDTLAHRKILSDGIAHFFKIDDGESLAKCLDRILHSGEKEKKRTAKAQKWAMAFTYEERAKKYRNFLFLGN